MSQFKTFPNYPKYKFIEVTPYKSSVKIDGKEEFKKVIPNILSCKSTDNKSFLYFKDIKKLYEQLQSSWLTGYILYDVETNKYNLFNILSGQLRFDINNQPAIYTTPINSPSKMHMFGFCTKTDNDVIWTWYDDPKIYNFNLPLSDISLTEHAGKKTLRVGFISHYPNIFISIDEDANFYIIYQYSYINNKFFAIPVSSEFILNYFKGEANLSKHFTEDIIKYEAKIINDFLYVSPHTIAGNSIDYSRFIPYEQYNKEDENIEEFSSDRIWITTFINRFKRNYKQVLSDIQKEFIKLMP